MGRSTADLYDDYGERLRVASPLFNDYGGKRFFEGPISTVRAYEDNSLVREALEEAGEGRVLVVDGGGSRHCALVGDRLAELGRRNGWAGIVVYGCIRDVDALSNIAIGIKAVAASPRKSLKKGQGERDVPVRFAEIDFCQNDYLYADADGIVVADRSLE